MPGSEHGSGQFGETFRDTTRVIGRIGDHIDWSIGTHVYREVRQHIAPHVLRNQVGANLSIKIHIGIRTDITCVSLLGRVDRVQRIEGRTTA